LVFLYGHLLLVLLLLLLVDQPVVSAAGAGGGQRRSGQHHQSNYAIVLSSSRYWFNYRHTANALSVYQILKQYGDFHDDDIVLMLADEWSVNPRNPAKNQIYNTARMDWMDCHPDRVPHHPDRHY
jgi:glycosylphosphatidylinositol transamidase (GPIT) subunit GPI8